MEFGILGPLEVRIGGRPVEVGGRKVRTLLAALVVDAGHVVSTDRLLEVLWGPEPPERAQATLHSHVSHLRDALEPDRARRRRNGVLLTREPGYLLAVDPDAVDACRFERWVADGRRALAAGAAEEAHARFRDALALWRGEALAEFSFETFAQAPIARLTELRLGALEGRIEADLARGEHGELTAELTALVREHPLRERLWGQLMLALYRSGQQAEALRAFADLRHALGEQLGIAPSAELSRLEELILLQKQELDWRPAAERGADPRLPGPGQRPQTAGVVRLSGDRLVAAGREACRRRAWREAFELLSAADESERLPPHHLEQLVAAAFWAGHSRECIDLWQRIHIAYVETGNRRHAGFAALMVSFHHALRSHSSVSGGWFALAHQLLDEEPSCVEQGYLAWGAAATSLWRDPAGALKAARTAVEIGNRFGDRSLRALGLTYAGYVLVHQGQLAEGMPLLDEAMATAVTGALSPVATATAVCRTLETCVDLHDYGRAREWLDAIKACSLGRDLAGFVAGDCRMHYAQTLLLRGAWSEAELQARQACAEMDDFMPDHSGLAFYTIGEVFRRTGKWDDAEAAFRKAEELGRSPQPGRALLHLARGDHGRATMSIQEALRIQTWDVGAEAPLLSAHVEIALACGDIATAREAAARLAAIAARVGTSGLQALYAYAEGAVALAGGDTWAAISSLRRSCQRWREIGATYEVARSRALLSAALVAHGDRASGAHELDAARALLDRMGAAT